MAFEIKEFIVHKYLDEANKIYNIFNAIDNDDYSTAFTRLFIYNGANITREPVKIQLNNIIQCIESAFSNIPYSAPVKPVFTNTEYQYLINIDIIEKYILLKLNKKESKKVFVALMMCNFTGLVNNYNIMLNIIKSCNMDFINYEPYFAKYNNYSYFEYGIEFITPEIINLGNIKILDFFVKYLLKDNIISIREYFVYQFHEINQYTNSEMIDYYNQMYTNIKYIKHIIINYAIPNDFIEYIILNLFHLNKNNINKRMINYIFNLGVILSDRICKKMIYL